MKYQLGLIPMSAKPFHSGHYYLVKKAVTECSSVKLFIGTGNRNKGTGKSITGEKMMHLWKNFYQPYMPNKNNIEFVYEGVPVRNVYEELDRIKSNEEKTSVAIYSGNEIEKNGKTLIWNRYNKLINDSYWANTLTFVSVERGIDHTTKISGTDMRMYLYNSNEKDFFKYLPEYLNYEQKESIYRFLKS